MHPSYTVANTLWFCTPGIAATKGTKQETKLRVKSVPDHGILCRRRDCTRNGQERLQRRKGRLRISTVAACDGATRNPQGASRRQSMASNFLLSTGQPPQGIYASGDCCSKQLCALHDDETCKKPAESAPRCSSEASSRNRPSSGPNTQSIRNSTWAQGPTGSGPRNSSTVRHHP